jgi:hypothetical protein
MNADAPVALLPLVEGGDIREPHDRLPHLGLPHVGLAHHRLTHWGLARMRLAPPAPAHVGLTHRGLLGVRLAQQRLLQPLQKPQGSITAAGTEHRSYGRVVERTTQLGEPSLVVASQVAVSPKNSRVVLDAIAFGDDGETRIE